MDIEIFNPYSLWDNDLFKITTDVTKISKIFKMEQLWKGYYGPISNQLVDFRHLDEIDMILVEFDNLLVVKITLH